MIIRLAMALLALFANETALAERPAPSKMRLADETTLGRPEPFDLEHEPKRMAVKIAFAKGGALVVIRRDGAIERWRLKDRTMTLLSASSGAVGVSADGGMLAIAHDKGQIIRQSAIGATRKPIGRLDGIEHVATSDEGVVAVSSGDHLIRLPRTERDMETTLPVRNGLAMAPDGRYVAAATGRYVSGSGHRGVVEAYGIEPATKRIFEMEGTVLGMWQLHIVNGRLATTTQTDAKSGLIVWDLATGRPIFQRRGFESYWVRALSFDASGNRMLSGDERGWLRLWDVDADRLLLERREPMPVQSTAISEDRSLVAWGLWNATVKVARVTSASK